jgi:hypothetical protein
VAEVRDSGTAQSSRVLKANLPMRRALQDGHLHLQFAPIRTASVPSFGSIELASCCLDSGAVLPGPHAKTADGFEQGMS